MKLYIKAKRLKYTPAKNHNKDSIDARKTITKKYRTFLEIRTSYIIVSLMINDQSVNVT